MNHFDIIIIGAGSGGLNIAGFMRRLGFKILLVDKSDANIGGDCLNFGCVPSKALIHVARTIASSRKSKEYGLSVGGAVEIEKVIAHIHRSKEIIRTHEHADWFRSLGIDVVLGEAKMVGPREIQVADERYRAKRIVIATGSRPRELDIPGIQEALTYTNETIFSITELPKRFVFIGGGPISVELGQAFAQLGSSVTIVSREDHILPREDSTMSAVLASHMEKDGVLFQFGASPVRVEGGAVLVVKDTAGTETKIPFDALFIGIGRVLNVEGLDLEKAGVAVEKGKIVVDRFLGTTNSSIFTVGDVAGGHQFTHAAELHAATLLRNMFLPRLFWKPLNSDHLSWVTYTSPEIATFGLGEEELKKRNTTYRVLDESFHEDDRAITDEYRDGAVKLFVATNGKLLGGTMVAPNAGELIQELILMNTLGIPAAKLSGKIYPYPSAARINKKVLSALSIERLRGLNLTLLRFLWKLFNR